MDYFCPKSSGNRRKSKNRNTVFLIRYAKDKNNTRTRKYIYKTDYSTSRPY